MLERTCSKKEFSFPAIRNEKWYSPLWRRVWQFLIKGAATSR